MGGIRALSLPGTMTSEGCVCRVEEVEVVRRALGDGTVWILVTTSAQDRYLVGIVFPIFLSSCHMSSPSRTHIRWQFASPEAKYRMA